MNKAIYKKIFLYKILIKTIEQGINNICDSVNLEPTKPNALTLPSLKKFHDSNIPFSV
jgi:hypothetical protein